MKLRSRRKDKEKEKLPSGITADYSANFFRDLNREPVVPSDNGYGVSPLDSPVDGFDTNLGCTSVTSHTNLSQPQIQQRALPLPPLPPRVVKKPNSKSGYRHSISNDGVSIDLAKTGGDATATTYQNSHSTVRPSSSLALEDTVDFAKANFEVDTSASRLPPSVFVSNYDKSSVKSPSVESLTDSTTNSSFATPPFSSSPVGEGQGYYSRFAVVLLNSSPDDAVSEFPLPDIEPAHLPTARELLIPRRTSPKKDFGFSLRRVMTVDRTSGGGQMKSVILAEMNGDEQGAHEVGLLPGDQLLEVNGVSVNDKTREEIVDLIKSSESAVRIKVSCRLRETKKRVGELVCQKIPKNYEGRPAKL